MKPTIIFTCLLLFLISCSKKPKPIDYGTDACDFCRMTIVDKIHGAELVTDKGKVYKFDSSECLLNFQKQNSDLSYAHQLTNYYENPTAFIDLDKAYFLKSEKLTSPMGANVTAFKTKSEADKIQAEKTGKVYTLEEVKSLLSK